MTLEKMRIITAIFKALTPVLFEIVDEILEAREKDSPGGEAITKTERQQIIMENVLDIPEIILKVVRDI